MKISKLFLMGLLYMGLFACSDNDNGFDRKPGEEVGSYMAIKLTGEKPTKTQMDDDDGRQPGIPAENKILNVQVLLADADGEVKYVFNPSGLAETNEGYETGAFPISIADEDLGESLYVYVIANTGTEKPLAVEGSVRSNTISDISEELMKDMYAKADNFWMFNECNGDDIKGVEITITAENSTAQNAAEPEAAIQLDRLAVKIRSSIDSNCDYSAVMGAFALESSTVSVEPDGFILLNGATEAYLQQHWKPSDTDNEFPDQLLDTPIEDLTNGNFYNTFSDFQSQNEDEDEEIVDKLAGETLAADPVYCMEHMSVKNVGGKSVRGGTTGLIYRFKLIKNDITDPHLYAYNGKYFATLDALHSTYSSLFGTKTLDEVKSELTAGGVATFRYKYNVEVFEEGRMYYTHFIKDQNYVDAEGENYYAVMRNTIYDLTVTRLLYPGTDIPGGWKPGPGPELPIDSENYYMQVDVTVNDWVLSSNNVELGK